MNRPSGLQHHKVTVPDEVVRRVRLLNQRKLGPKDIVERMKDEGWELKRNTVVCWIYQRSRRVTA